MGFGTGEALGTAPSTDAARSAAVTQLADEFFDQGGLTDTGFARDAQQQPPAGRRLLEASRQRLTSAAAAHHVLLRCWTCGCRRLAGRLAGQFAQERDYL